jgi:lysophospholipase L1-like esterase
MSVRRAWIAVAACCLAVLGAAWLVFTVVRPSVDAPTAATVERSFGRSDRPTMAVVGASYSAALGASSPSRGYAPVAAAQLGWRVQVSAVAGTGYLNPGPHHQGTFLHRLRRLRGAHRAGVVLIQGGRNDAHFRPRLLRSAVCATVAGARARFAGAHVVLLGDVPFHVPVPAAQRRVARTLWHAATQCRAAFVNPIAQRWITRSNEARLLGPVPGHPNDAGYAYIAHKLVTNLRRLGIVGDVRA